jgi:hypothetical protein
MGLYIIYIYICLVSQRLHNTLFLCKHDVIQTSLANVSIVVSILIGVVNDLQYIYIYMYVFTVINFYI